MKNKSILPLHPLWYLLLLVVTSSIYSIINQSSGHAVDVTTIIDGEIPFIKEFVVPYLLWYPYIYGLLIYYCFVDRKNYFVALGSLVSGKLICFLVYCLWQSTVPRPEVVGNDIFAHLMRVVYSHDQPVNCLPSIHVLTTFIMMIIVHKRKEQHKWEYIGVTAMGTLIIFSTLFTKQHAVLDVLSGILLACGVYAAIQYMFQALSAHQANHFPARQMKK
ncbi:phosphatase PAP2 family protein [Peribacillus muralis]|uniref:phosphatase PAP2 family protein n=1 Tax=Peribacillus muralis TaxID=264697 RepID=UPI00366EA7C2